MISINTTQRLPRNLFALVAGIIALALISNLAFAHGMSESEKQTILQGGNLRYMWIGVTHMLSGYDHLAFVFGIIFFLTTFRDIAKYVTAFTLGHSVTLIFATFNAIQLNYFLVDAVIALSVCYIAFANIDGFRKYLNVNPPNMMAMIAGLGLIHGFGLSTRLQELPLSEDHLLMNIISFNVGIELGQISALALMLLVIAAWRKSHFFQTFSLIANYTLILAGALLFLMQMHGYEHIANAEELGGDAATASAPAPVVEITQTQALASTDWKDTIPITIPARGELEYKVHMTQGKTFEYAWDIGDTALYFDFHADPDDGSTFQSFKKSTEKQSSGVLTAPFTGKYGWYWKNTTRDPVTVTLKVKGDFQLVQSKKEEQAKPVQDAVGSTHESIN